MRGALLAKISKTVLFFSKYYILWCLRAGLNLIWRCRAASLNFSGVNFIDLTLNLKVSQVKFSLRYEIKTDYREMILNVLK